MEIIIIAFLLLLIYFIIEKKMHQRNLNAIALRVNVNGIRGKSTVTRLITGICKEAEIKVVGKTTGTAARMLFWYTEEEFPIVRPRVGPNIGEQRKVVAKAAKLGAEALVSECMAVSPDYQIAFQNQLLQANIGVIVNVLDDHMDVMGPTSDWIADAFTATIPYNGKLIIAQGPYVDFFKKIAANRHSEVFVADTDRITKADLARFDYLVFPENIALALACAKAVGVEKEIAWKGMLKANPDPGILRIHKLKILERETYFINGFAANDASSTLAIWQRIKDLDYPTDNPIIIMNCRKDRVDRSTQFAESVLPQIQASMIVVIGSNTKPIIDAYLAGKYPIKDCLDLEVKNGVEVYKTIEDQIAGKLVFGIGNIHGTAEELIDVLLKNDEQDTHNDNRSRRLYECTEQNYTLPL